MNTLALRFPGWAWLPQVLRSSGYWREVGRFAVWGPLIGGAPYAMFVVTLPFIYIIGLAPAIIAGLLFAAWITPQRQRVSAWPWRLAVGAGSAVLAAGLCMLAFDDNRGREGPIMFAVFALHGVPAAIALALSYPPRSPKRFRNPSQPERQQLGRVGAQFSQLTPNARGSPRYARG